MKFMICSTKGDHTCLVCGKDIPVGKEFLHKCWESEPKEKEWTVKLADVEQCMHYWFRCPNCGCGVELFGCEDGLGGHEKFYCHSCGKYIRVTP